MFVLFLMILVVLLIAVYGFEIAILVVRQWTGCNRDEAIKKIHNKVNRIPYIPLGQDPGLWSEIWAAIRKIIGEARFDKLRRIYEALDCSMGGIRPFGHHSGLPYIVIILEQLNDTERKLIGAVVEGIVKRHLRMRGLPDSVIATWGTYDNGLVYLEVRFAETDGERTIMRTTLANELGQGTQTDDKDPLFQ